MILEQEGYQVKLLRKRIKNLNLRIHSTGNVTLSVPMKCPLDFIQAYLQNKQDWITFHRTRLQTQPVTPVLQLKTGESLFFLGKPYELIVYYDFLQKKITIDETCLHLFTPPRTTLKEKQALLTRWYRDQFKKLLPDLIKKWEPVIGVQVNSWGIKAMKTRWGSCNTLQKRLWLNFYLIQKPLFCLEYVLVHEMVHLLEPSHNKRFYTLMSQFMPNWQHYKKQLENKKIG